MLTLSTNAVPIIKRITRRAAEPDQAGLRISEGDDADTLSLKVSASAAAGDMVLLYGGARVFISPTLSPRLEDLELYAVEKDGRLRFALRRRS